MVKLRHVIEIRKTRIYLRFVKRLPKRKMAWSHLKKTRVLFRLNIDETKNEKADMERSIQAMEERHQTDSSSIWVSEEEHLPQEDWWP